MQQDNQSFSLARYASYARSHGRVRTSFGMGDAMPGPIRLPEKEESGHACTVYPFRRKAETTPFLRWRYQF